MDLINDSVMNRLTGDFIKLSKVLGELNITVSAKQMSELVSALLENAIADNIDGAIAPKVDSEPDILYNGNSVEIKTSTGETWRGGTFSKRPGYYLFVKWELNHNGSPRFYIAGVQLQESDWKKTKSKTYYATTFGKKELFAKHNSVTEYVGSIEQSFSKNGNVKGLKVNTE